MCVNYNLFRWQLTYIYIEQGLTYLSLTHQVVDNNEELSEQKYMYNIKV